MKQLVILFALVSLLISAPVQAQRGVVDCEPTDADRKAARTWVKKVFPDFKGTPNRFVGAPGCAVRVIGFDRVKRSVKNAEFVVSLSVAINNDGAVGGEPPAFSRLASQVVSRPLYKALFSDRKAQCRTDLGKVICSDANKGRVASWNVRDGRLERHQAGALLRELDLAALPADVRDNVQKDFARDFVQSFPETRLHIDGDSTILKYESATIRMYTGLFYLVPLTAVTDSYPGWSEFRDADPAAAEKVAAEGKWLQHDTKYGTSFQPARPMK